MIRLPLPERVPCLSLHQPYAGLCAAKPPDAPPEAPGLKSLETRTWPWPVKRYPFPAVALLCASAKAPEPGLFARIFPRVPDWARPMLRAGLGGKALALIEVIGCRPLTAEDEPRSFWWDEEENRRRPRFAFELARVEVVFPFPVSGLQKLARTVPRELVEEHRIARAA